MQLAAEKEFCAWRLPAGAAALGRKSQSLQDFLCTLGAQVSDMSRISRETENRAISISWVVELRGFEPMAHRGRRDRQSREFHGRAESRLPPSKSPRGLRAARLLRPPRQRHHEPCTAGRRARANDLSAAGAFSETNRYDTVPDGHVSGLGKVRHREFPMATGEMTPEAFTSFDRRARTDERVQPSGQPRLRLHGLAAHRRTA